MVDVTVKEHISAPPELVAAVMFDPEQDPAWIGGARKSETLGSGPYGLGTRVRRTGSFFGRKFSWVTEVTEFEPERLVRMKHVSGPFKGGVDYSVRPVGSGAEATVRNYGRSSFWVPFLATMMRRSVAGDLRRLKRLVESGRR